MPAISSTHDVPAAQLRATVRSEPGDLVIVLPGLTGVPIQQAPIDEPFWLRPNAFAFHTVAIQPAGALATTVSLPPNPALRGLRVTWQAVVQNTAGELLGSNPSIQAVP